MKTIHPPRRTFLKGVVLAMCAGTWPLAHAAQSGWSARPITMVVPYAPGGLTDVLTRALARSLGERLGQTMVVENKGGANTILGTDAVAKGDPDGHYFGIAVATSLINNPILYKELPYEVERDLALVSMVASVPLLLVAHPSVKGDTGEALRQTLRANPGKFSYGAYSIGNYGHLAAMHLDEAADARMVSAVYRGEAPMVQDVLGQHIHLAFASPATCAPHIAAGTLKVLGVTGTQRLTSMPNVPTLAENGFDGEIYRMNPGWIAIVAPAKTPPDIVRRMSEQVVSVVHEPAVHEMMVGMGLVPVGSTPEAFAEIYRNEAVIWRDLLTKAGIQPQ